MSDRRKTKTNRPWGRLAGLSAWCLVVLVGALFGIDPEVVLVRAVAAGVLVGVAAAVAARCVQAVLQ
jgi:hypothetical protein